jgi:hypothetical protein
MRKVLLIFLFFTSTLFFGQKRSSENEEHIYSFKTTRGKTLSLSKSTIDSAIIYRYGTDSKIEMEQRSSDADTSRKMRYSYYLRGGGIQNEGMDLDYLYFTKDNFQYIVYNTYFARGSKVKTGIRIIDLNTKKSTLIPADRKTIKGSLSDFRDNRLLEIGDEIFD